MIIGENFVVIGGTGNHALSIEIIDWIKTVTGTGIKLSFNHIDFDKFGDGEPDFKIQNPEIIKDKIVILIQSMYTPVLQEQFLTLAWAAKEQYKAKHVIAVLPFIRFRRQDRKEKKHEINRNLMLAHNIKFHGVDQVIFCDIHSKTSLENCEKVGLKAYNVSPAPVFAKIAKTELESLSGTKNKVWVYSPDEGSISRALELAKILNISVLVDLKNRSNDGTVTSVQDDDKLKELEEKYQTKLTAAEPKHVKGATIIVREDELSSGGTAVLAGWKLKNDRAAKLIFFATHPVCVRGWKRKFVDSNPFDLAILGNTIPRGYEKSTGGRVGHASMGKVIAQQLILVMKEAQKEFI